jgi:hypothetical protein
MGELCYVVSVKIMCRVHKNPIPLIDLHRRENNWGGKLAT